MNAPWSSHAPRVLAAAALIVFGAGGARAQDHASDHAPDHAPSHSNAELHMTMTPVRHGTAADTARAARVASVLRGALAKYRDTSAAVADGYQMFLPNVKDQRVYHFTNRWRALQEAFRFEPTRPTSLLYTKGADGRFTLVGAMYTAPERFDLARLDARVPLSVARWHRHVNWCVPGRGDAKRWLERRDGMPLFGPESPVATKAACDAVGGRFHESVFGWMLHANVMMGDDPAVVWNDDHMRHDAGAMMEMGGPAR